MIIIGINTGEIKTIANDDKTISITLLKKSLYILHFLV